MATPPSFSTTVPTIANQELPSVLFRPSARVLMHINDDHSGPRAELNIPLGESSKRKTARPEPLFGQ
ncbi:hypothetical protein SynNOUM97013_01242 [Synechococcus sp. NOUM97013]|nr:hypothetical protein SynNOUM97013_01242 [Synechococcus sp. NOUM97013]